MTSTKLPKVAAELTSVTDTLAQLFVQRVELVVQQTHHQVVHCLRKYEAYCNESIQSFKGI